MTFKERHLLTEDNTTLLSNTSGGPMNLSSTLSGDSYKSLKSENKSSTDIGKPLTQTTVEKNSDVLVNELSNKSNTIDDASKTQSFINRWQSRTT